jgi:hypothetical protein
MAVIGFRYHLVSLASVFFALAVGIAVGSGPLLGLAGADDAQREQLRAESDALRAEVADAQTRLAFAEGYGEATAATLTDGTLTDRLVLLVVQPGADDDVVDATADAVVAADGGVTGTIVLDDAWTDAAQEAVLDTLAVQLVASGTRLSDGDGYLRGAEVLAGAVLGGDGAPDIDVLAAFEEAGLLAWTGPMQQRADLAVVVAGNPFDDEEAERRQAAAGALVGALDAAGAGAVAAGGPASAGEGGLVRVVRDTPTLAREASTVDVLTTVAGRTAAVLALAEQADGGSGHYGAVDDVDGALPQ